MNDNENILNANRNDLSALNMNDICWNASHIEDLQDQIIPYLKGIVEAPSTKEGQDLFTFFRSELFINPNNFKFNTLCEEQKPYFGIIFYSFLFVHYLATTCAWWSKASYKMISGDSDWRPQDNDKKFSVKDVESDKKEKDEEEVILDEEVNEQSEKSKSFYIIDPSPEEGCFSINSLPEFNTRSLFWYSTTPPLRKVFDHLTHIKHSFHFLLEFFYNAFGSIKHLNFDYITYNSIFDSILKEDYKQFCAIIYDWDDTLVSQLSIMVELAYPTFYYIESHKTDYDSTLERFKNGLSAQDLQIITTPITLIISYYTIYLFSNILDKYLDDFDRVMPYMCFSGFKKGFVKIFFDWINSETEAISEFFRNHPDNALPDNNVTEISSDSTGTSYNDGTANEKHQKLGSGDEAGNPPKEKPKRHLSVGHDVEAIKKLATYLVKGFTNERGSLPALVSSNDEKNITINKLIFLFTGNKDYSFDGPYNLTWNAEQVYLKLLIKLLHNLNELATGSHAVDEKRSDYISDKYIKCHLKGGVWPKVAEAFENIKSEANIRNADYKKNYKDTTAPINQKRLRDLKVIADLWLKCKNDIDF